LAKDIATRRSVTDVVREYTKVVYAWKVVKQSGIVLHTNGSEIRSFFKGIKRTILFRRFLESVGKPVKGPTPAYEDNDAAILQIKADKLTPRIKHLDIMMSWSHETGNYGQFVAIYCETHLNINDMNTKPHGRQTLQNKHLWLVG